jgi:hypothetical protein
MDDRQFGYKPKFLKETLLQIVVVFAIALLKP